ncbi:MAG: transcriptional regulator with PAS, ATPase and Fis domain [Polyangiales bacterium]|jgi:transcriptional regulator with PAS, ATPase and Fis domain
MTFPDHGSTTAAISTTASVTEDSTPGFVLVYSRLHDHLPSVLPFATQVTTLGREAANDLAIAESAVSRHHARVTLSNTGALLEDLGSTNGTMVNGQRVQACLLQEHDVIRVGDTIFRFTASNAYAYGAYRVDGSIVGPARGLPYPKSEILIGGYQVDRVVGLTDKVAATSLSAVVVGESGTGKELVARELHGRSGRSGPFQAINCAALPATLLESELFGYRKGAFTGANSDKTGLIQSANGGTLFLDEIGDMPVEAQAKLLRVLQERMVLPIGATVPEPVDVRVVCATHRDLDQRVADGAFRGDLLARLREVEIRLPALSKRLEDLYPLVRHFLNNADAPTMGVSLPFMLCLAHYPWPYNVRELESAVRVALALHETGDLDVRLLPRNVQDVLETHGDLAESPRTSMTAGPSSSTVPTEAELRALLTRHQGNVAAAGRELGKERMQIHRWAKRFGINLEDFRSS